MSQNLQNFVKFQNFQLENLVDFEKCCKTHIYLQKSVPIQPKTSNILLNFCQKLATGGQAMIALYGGFTTVCVGAYSMEAPAEVWGDQSESCDRGWVVRICISKP